MAVNSLPLVRKPDTIIENFALTGAQNYDLPSTGVKAGQMVLVYNDTANNSILTIRSNNGNTVDSIYKGYCVLLATVDTPTTSTHWRVLDIYFEATHTAIFGSGAFIGGSAQSKSLTLRRNGKTVTMQIQSTGATTNNGPSDRMENTGTELPVAFRPASPLRFPISAVVNSVNQAGTLVVSSNGEIGIRFFINETSTVANGTANTGYNFTSVSWPIA